MLLLFNLTGGGIITQGILDWQGAALPVWIQACGGISWLAGMILAVMAVTCLGVINTTGNSSGLVIKGPYRWTRNPQYLGMMVALIGWGLMTGSILTLITGGMAWIPLCLVPRTEEPWLLERYGAAYQEYLQSVPRFLWM